MVAEGKVFNQSTGEAMISTLAREKRMDERVYLGLVAKNSYVLVKESKSGLKVAVWDNGLPMFFETKALAEEEMTDTENTDIKYNGYKVMSELEYWNVTGASDIFFDLYIHNGR